MEADELLPRRLGPKIDVMLGEARALVISGPRQAGKSELMRTLHRRRGGAYRYLDDTADLLVARVDPSGFLAEQPESIRVRLFGRD